MAGMTVVEELRQAAKLMRRRAQAATPGPWEAAGRIVDQVSGDYAEVLSREVECMSYCYGGSAVLPKEADAAFIASMHPGVALAVAKWLDEVADDRHASLPSWVENGALAIARAYLGTGEQ